MESKNNIIGANPELTNGELYKRAKAKECESQLPNYQQRMVEELKDLNKDIEKYKDRESKAITFLEEQRKHQTIDDTTLWILINQRLALTDTIEDLERYKKFLMLKMNKQE